MKSITMRKISYAVLIIGLIGSFISGAMFKTYDFEKQEFVYNSELVISGIIEIFVLFVVLFTLATILKKLESLEKNNLDILRYLKELKDSETIVTNSKHLQTTKRTHKKTPNDVTNFKPVIKQSSQATNDKKIIRNCIKCGAKLGDKKTFCENCGAYQLLQD